MLALLLAAQLVGGRVYAARVEAGGAQIAVWRYTAARERRGPPVVIFGELGFDKSFVEPLARALQARGREVFVPEWRGQGHSARPLPALGGLDALFGLDAPAALDVALEGAPCAQLVGVGLGGAAAYLLADRACSVVAVNVPARYEVPNEALRRLIAAVHAVDGQGDRVGLRPWADFPSTMGRHDLFSLLFSYGDEHVPRLTPGAVSPDLLEDVARWMQQGTWPGLPAALDALHVPLLVVTSPRDNLVHPEHALALHKPHDTLVLSRIEGYDEDAGHLALLAPWAREQLFPEIARWLASH